MDMVDSRLGDLSIIWRGDEVSSRERSDMRVKDRI